MDKYSRLLVHLSTVNTNKTDIYPSFLKDIEVLQSPSEELIKTIKDDLATILPAILILAVHDDVSVRVEIARTFDTFSSIINKEPTLKNETWWKDMEAKLISLYFSSRLVKMAETNDDPWANDWSFVSTLIVDDEHVNGTAINSLLKVVETAFKMSKKNDAVLERAYFCWNQLIDIFSKHPRVVCSQKLVELLVRPLSTTHFSMKCPDLKMQTWCNLMKKIGFSCGNKCKFVIEPFIDYMYLKGEDSLSVNYSKSCLEAFAEMIEQKKIYKYYALKVMSAFPRCYESCASEDAECLIRIWTGILDNIQDVDKNNRNEYILEIFTRFQQISQIEKTELNNKLMKILVDKKLFNIDNLRICITSELSLVSVFSDFMKYYDFRDISFSEAVKDLKANFSEATKKSQSNVVLQIWDLLCEIYALWLKNMNGPQESTLIDKETLSSLLMIPFIYKQWSVSVQKTWYSVLDAVHITVPENDFLTYLLEKINDGLKESFISAGLCVDICAHLTNKDKSAFKLVMPTLQVASSYLPPKDSKPLLDMLVLLENAVNNVPKNEIATFLNKLMIYGNKYEHPYGIRIKTKISKVQRKVYSLKEPTENKDQENAKNSNDSEQGNGSKVRSPIIAQSNFLQRLAKAEEKKKKKCPTMASIFGDSQAAANNSHDESSPINNENNEPVRTISPVEVNEKGASEDNKTSGGNIVSVEPPVMNGRCSPALPHTVTIVTTPKSKRSQTRSPEPILASQDLMKKPLPVKSPAPPVYFEDEAQDFIVVPPKPRTTPLTEHQKEMLSKRRSDIPALYQDLSQDTLSDSQSLKEITILKNPQSDTLKNAQSERGEFLNKVEQVGDVNKPDQPEKGETDKPDHAIVCPNGPNDNDEGLQKPEIHNIIEKDELIKSSIIVPEGNLEPSKESHDKIVTSLNVKNTEETGTDINSTEVSEQPNDSNDFVDPNIKENTTLEHEENKLQTSCEKSEGSQDIIDDTPQFEPAVSLNLTPSKQPCPPTPRSLISRLNLLDQDESPDNKKAKFIEDKTDEREKENIIINSKDNLEKMQLKEAAKRRSLRKSTSKYISKKIDEVKEVKLKPKKECSDTPVKVTVDGEDGLNNKSDSVQDNDHKAVLNQINVQKEMITNSSSGKISVNDVKSSDVTLKPEKEVILSTKEKTKEETEKISENDHPLDGSKTVDNMSSAPEGNEENQSEVKVHAKETNGSSEEEDKEATLMEEMIMADLQRTVNDNVEVNLNPAIEFTYSMETNSTESNDRGLIDDVKDVSDGGKNSDESILSRSDVEENSESPSADVSTWALTTPKRKRKKKILENCLSPQFSPKQLRSKRLSLTKSPVTGQIQKKIKKSTSEKDVEFQSSSERVTISTSDHNQPKSSTDNVLDSESSPSGPPTPANENNSLKKTRKRRNQDESSPEIEGKKRKSEGGDDINQDPLLLVKNIIVKPRKKKIIKSNIKHSPNNLEHWLIKSGKTVVKTSLIPQENGADETESKVIEDSSDIQANVSNSENVNTNQNCSTNQQNPEIMIIDASPEVTNDSDDIHNCTVINDFPSLHLSCNEGESDTTLNESTSEETLQPAATPDDEEETVGQRTHRRKRRLLKREETPFREGFGSPEDESFDSKRERLTTPFRKSGRSAQMVMMATTDDEQEQPQTPQPRRSIPAVHLTGNWPEGRLEEWVPCMPTPPGVSPSLGILRRKPALSPTSSPTSSPVMKKKRVSFLDPPVSKGLLYCKGAIIGQIQHANIPPGERPLWKDNEIGLEEAGPSSQISKESVDGGFEAVEEDELTAIQEFLNSTPDAPWSKAIPPELDVKQIAGLDLCPEPIEHLLERLSESEDERNRLCEEMKKLNVITVADIRSITLMDLNKLCNAFPKVKFLARSIEDYLKDKAIAQVLTESGEETEVKEAEPEAGVSGLVIESVSSGDNENNHSVQTNPVSLNSDSGISEEPHEGSQKLSVSELIKDSAFKSDLAEHITELLLDKEFLDRITDKIPQLLEENSPFVDRLAVHAGYSFIARLCTAIEFQRGKPG